jgi:hypothetical protein
MANSDLIIIFVQISNGFLTCRNILRHGDAALTFASERRRAADSYSPRLDLNPRILSPAASTLTSAPPMTTDLHF